MHMWASENTLDIKAHRLEKLSTGPFPSFSPHILLSSTSFYCSYSMNWKLAWAGGYMISAYSWIQTYSSFLSGMYVQSPHCPCRKSKVQWQQRGSTDINRCWQWSEKNILEQLHLATRIACHRQEALKNIKQNGGFMYCFKEIKRNEVHRALPETCLYLYHVCTPLQPSDFWIKCKRCCADLYSW